LPSELFATAAESRFPLPWLDTEWGGDVSVYANSGL